MLRRFAVIVAVLLTSCSRQPVSDEVTIEVEKADHVRVTAQTTFNDSGLDNADQLSRVETARAAAQSGTDAWGNRFARVTLEDEEVTVQKHRGKVDRVIRSVRIPAGELQQVFSDANITVQILNGDGWRELRLYPGGSVRATREQRRHFEDAMGSWSTAVANYFTAIDHLYTYMNQHPDRAQDLFAAIIIGNPGDVEPVVAEEEQPLVDHVVATMEEIGSRMDTQEADGVTFADEADLLYNPFPARLTVKLPGEVLSAEGFPKDLVIEPVNLLQSIAALEGRWISPDPLAAILRDEGSTSQKLANEPRQSRSSVNATDVAAALREQMVRPKAYVVRWRG
jgi:hypothetical protein